MSSAVVTALEQLEELCKAQKVPDSHKAGTRLLEARRDVQRKQPVHHYRLLGLPQSCAVDEVRQGLNLRAGTLHAFIGVNSDALPKHVR